MTKGFRDNWQSRGLCFSLCGMQTVNTAYLLVLYTLHIIKFISHPVSEKDGKIFRQQLFWAKHRPFRPEAQPQF